MENAEVAHDGLPIELESDKFFRRLIRELSGTLQDVVGVVEEAAAGVLGVGGQRTDEHDEQHAHQHAHQHAGERTSEQADDPYRRALRMKRLDRTRVTRACLGRKSRHPGYFCVAREKADKIVLGNIVLGNIVLSNRASPWGEMVAAENLSRARIPIPRTMAHGDPHDVADRRPPDRDETPEGQELSRS